MDKAPLQKCEGALLFGKRKSPINLHYNTNTT